MIKRDLYLQQLVAGKGNGLIKIITGIRRCGKSFLLFNLFYKHLIESGVFLLTILSRLHSMIGITGIYVTQMS